MTAEPALATIGVEILRPERLLARGMLRADGVVELDLGEGGVAEIPAPQLPNVLARNLHLGPRPRPVAADGLMHCEREALDLLLDAPERCDAVLGVAFGLDLDAGSAAALRSLALSPAVLHWRLRARWGADRSRTCEVVDGGAAGLWRVKELAGELGGGILLAAVSATEVWRRLSSVVPAEVDLDG